MVRKVGGRRETKGLGLGLGHTQCSPLTLQAAKTKAKGIGEG